MAIYESSAVPEMTGRKPSKWLTALEFPRAINEMAMLLPANRFLKNLEKGDGHPVIVIPGFSADNRTTSILRRYLDHWGYAAEPWELDRNINPRDLQGFEDVIRFREDMKAKVGSRIQELHESTGKQVSLIGWSLGGIFSRVLASDNQESVRQVITLGTPFGDPRTVPIYSIMEKIQKRPMTKEHYDDWMAMCNMPLGDVKLTILHSFSDGFVSKDVSTNDLGEHQESVHVCSSHVGFAVNPMVLYLVAHRLRWTDDEWEKFSTDHPLASKLFRRT